MTQPSPQALKALLRRARSVRSMEDDVPSPCTSVCTMDAISGLCLGCQRSLQEIGGWSVASNTQKKQIWQAIEQRLLNRTTPPNGDTA